VLADKGHDSDELRADVHLQASHPLIAWTSNRKQPGTLDPARYARPDRIERMMGLLKRFRRIATRHDKTAASLLSFVEIAAIHSWVRFAYTARRRTGARGPAQPAVQEARPPPVRDPRCVSPRGGCDIRSASA
jgi:hypothetical protein